MLFEMWVVLHHAEFDGEVQDILIIDQIQQLLILDADVLQLWHDLLSYDFFGFAGFILRKKQRLEEEINAVREEHVGFGGVQDQRRQVFAVLQATLDVHTADLWNIILQIISIWWVEIWVDSALFQVLNSALLMRIQLEQAVDGIVWGQSIKLLSL